MSALLIAVLLPLGWLAKQVLGSLLSEQVRGTLTDYVTNQARTAAEQLPPELADEY